MAGPLDHQVGIGVETTYGTAVTPTRFAEWDMDKSNHHFDPKFIQGTGMQVGDGGIDRASRSVSVVGQANGAVAMDYQSRGMGLWLNPFFGNGTSTLVSGSTYQHVFTSALSTPVTTASTLEYGVVRADLTGTVDAWRYAGVSMTKLTIACNTGEIASFMAEWDGKSSVLSQSPATPSYPAGLLAPFHYGQAAVTVGGTVVLPTSTVLASGGTAVTNARSFTFGLDNAPDVDDWALGGVRNQPTVRKRVGTLDITARDDSAVYDGYLTAHTTVPITITFTKQDESLSVGFATLQLVFPSCKLNDQDRPNPSVDTPTNTLSMRVLKPDTGAAVYIVHRTADVTL